MKYTGRSKSRMSKFQAKMGVFGGIGMLLFFVCVFILKWETIGTIIFFVLWVGIVCAAIYQSYTNAVSDEGIPHEETTHDLNVVAQAAPERSYAQRIRDLEQLKVDGLISQEEYIAKRKDILDEDWGG